MSTPNAATAALIKLPPIENGCADAPVQMHAMVDLETWGKRPGCAINAIGAVKFSTEGVRADGFYVRINAASCESAGLKVDLSTVEWWMKQGDKARLEVVQPGVSLRTALEMLAWWLGKDIDVWGNGPAFDNGILVAAYDALGMEAPWQFWRDRCYRTLKAMNPQVPMAARVGTHHNALDDARSQAEHVLSMWQWGWDKEAEEATRRRELVFALELCRSAMEHHEERSPKARRESLYKEMSRAMRMIAKHAGGLGGPLAQHSPAYWTQLKEWAAIEESASPAARRASIHFPKEQGVRPYPFADDTSSAAYEALRQEVTMRPAGVRLVIITGPMRVGKTMLARELLARAGHEHPLSVSLPTKCAALELRKRLPCLLDKGYALFDDAVSLTGAAARLLHQFVTAGRWEYMPLGKNTTETITSCGWIFITSWKLDAVSPDLLRLATVIRLSGTTP